MVDEKLKPTSIEQYRKEVRSVIAKKSITSEKKLQYLLNIMKKDPITTTENVNRLKTELQKLTYNSQFHKCLTMGDILETGLRFVARNYLISKK